MHGPIPRSAIATFVLARGVLGFVIGISVLRMSWWLHGILLGFVVSVPAALSIRLMPSMSFGVSPNVLSMLALLLGLVIGFLIELVTSVVFKAKSESTG
jgi:hypothetical protein